MSLAPSPFPYPAAKLWDSALFRRVACLKIELWPGNRTPPVTLRPLLPPSISLVGSFLVPGSVAPACGLHPAGAAQTTLGTVRAGFVTDRPHQCKRMNPRMQGVRPGISAGHVEWRGLLETTSKSVSRGSLVVGQQPTSGRWGLGAGVCTDPFSCLATSLLGSLPRAQ